ncbi:MAG: hypothetical protein Q9159_000612 [Coniocarpon cinnabarinum]
MVGVRGRRAKVAPKTVLTIIRESELSQYDDHNDNAAAIDAAKDDVDPNTGVQKIKTGVEEHEEKEHHLQAIINAAAQGRKTDGAASIPVPEARPAKDINYDQLFSARFAQPSTYIRFSSTVEDCTGASYSMDEEDVAFLKKLNLKHASQQSPRKRRNAGGQPDEPRLCSEEWFEQVMTSFEETSALRQPFANVDHPPVLPFDELATSFDDESVDEGARAFAREIYDHWKARRSDRHDQMLMAQLKTPRLDGSGGQDADDNDPFVCFRRREFRQARKTRGRDAQVIDKLKRLRKELEEGRYLLHQVRERENGHRVDLQLSREIYDTRHKLRRVKCDSKITDDDEALLVNQRPREPLSVRTNQGPASLPRSASGTTLRLRPPDDSSDMVDLQIKLAERLRDVNAQIQNSVAAHERWNRNFIDNTESALLGAVTPADMFLPDEERTSAQGRGFVGVKVEEKHVPTQQPTPPESIVNDSQSEKSLDGEVDHRLPSPPANEPHVQWANSSEYPSFKNTGRFRRRIGRGGRMMIDRHNFRLRSQAKTDDRFAFDRDSGDEESSPSPDLDSTECYAYRVQWANGGQSISRKSSSGAAAARDAPPPSVQVHGPQGAVAAATQSAH